MESTKTSTERKPWFVLASGLIVAVMVLAFTRQSFLHSEPKVTIADKYTPSYFQLKDSVLQVINSFAHYAQINNEVISNYDRDYNFQKSKACYFLRTQLSEENEQLKNLLVVLSEATARTWATDSLLLLQKLSNHTARVARIESKMKALEMTPISYIKPYLNE